MSDVITGVGEYRTQDGSRATVEFISKTEWAFGQIDRLACFWWVKNGKSPDYIAHGGRYDITGPFVPPRKPVEGWVNFYKNTVPKKHPEYVDPEFFATEAEAREWTCVEHHVRVRQYDPKAEQEAREILCALRDRVPANSQVGLSVRRALLLFPEAS